MTNKDDMREEVADISLKVGSAQKTANAPDATAREKADLKLLEQEALAQKLRLRRPGKRAKHTTGKIDGKLDRALEDSLPGSDSVSFFATNSGEGDLPLTTVKVKKASRSVEWFACFGRMRRLLT